MSAPDYSQITDQRLRVEIALTLGWTRSTGFAGVGSMHSPNCTCFDGAECDIPNYPASLDACAEFEAAMNEVQLMTYADTLMFSPDCKGLIRRTITAAPRLKCLAYLSVVAPGKLKEI